MHAQHADFLAAVYASGILVLRRSEAFAVSNAPITTRPTPFKRALYCEAVELQPLVNELVHRLATSDSFIGLLEESLGSTDEFMNHLFALYRKSRSCEWRRRVAAGFFRNDFLVEERLCQVELNTFCCAFPSLSARVAQLLHSGGSVPANDCEGEIVDLLLRCNSLYSSLLSACGLPTLVVIAVLPGEKNIFDQLHLMNILGAVHGVECRRLTFSEIAAQCSKTQDGHLVWHGSHQVSCVYLRAGYDPAEYGAPETIEARELCELSRCIPVPSVSYQLIGKKIAQCLLFDEEIFRTFLPEERFQRLRPTFVFQKPLAAISDQEEREIVGSPSEFVIKPQRDGGGHNLFGEAVREAVLDKAFNRRAYVLMHKIKAKPASHTTAVASTGEPVAFEGISELGIYGSFVYCDGCTLKNSSSGYLLRTKPAEVNETGVVAGFGFLDAPSLVDE